MSTRSGHLFKSAYKERSRECLLKCIKDYGGDIENLISELLPLNYADFAKRVRGLGPQGKSQRCAILQPHKCAGPFIQHPDTEEGPQGRAQKEPTERIFNYPSGEQEEQAPCGEAVRSKRRRATRSLEPGRKRLRPGKEEKQAAKFPSRILNRVQLRNCYLAGRALEAKRYGEFLIRLGPVFKKLSNHEVAEWTLLKHLTMDLNVHDVDGLRIDFPEIGDAREENECMRQWEAVAYAVHDSMYKNPRPQSLEQVPEPKDRDVPCDRVGREEKVKKLQSSLNDGGSWSSLFKDKAYSLEIDSIKQSLEPLDSLEWQLEMKKEKSPRNETTLGSETIKRIYADLGAAGLVSCRRALQALRKGHYGEFLLRIGPLLQLLGYEVISETSDLRWLTKDLHSDQAEDLRISLPAWADITEQERAIRQWESVVKAAYELRLCEEQHPMSVVVPRPKMNPHKEPQDHLTHLQADQYPGGGIHELLSNFRNQLHVALAEEILEALDDMMPTEEALMCLRSLHDEIKAMNKNDADSGHRFYDRQQQDEEVMENEGAQLYPLPETLFEDMWRYVKKTQCLLKDMQWAVQNKITLLHDFADGRVSKANAILGLQKGGCPEDVAEELRILLESLADLKELRDFASRIKDLKDSFCRVVKISGDQDPKNRIAEYGGIVVVEAQEGKNDEYEGKIKGLETERDSKAHENTGLRQVLTDIAKEIAPMTRSNTNAVTEDEAGTDIPQLLLKSIREIRKSVVRVLGIDDTGNSFQDIIEKWADQIKELQAFRNDVAAHLSSAMESAGIDASTLRNPQGDSDGVKVRLDALLYATRHRSEPKESGREDPKPAHGSANCSASLLLDQGRAEPWEHMLVPIEKNPQKNIDLANYHDTNEVQEMTKVVLQCHGRITCTSSLAKAKQDPKTALLDICRTMNEILDSVGADGAIHQLGPDLKELSLLRAHKLLIERHLENMREALSLPNGELLGPQGLVVQVEEKVMQHIAQIKLWYGCVYGATKTQDGDFQTRQTEMESICRDTKQDGYDATFQDLLRDTRDLCLFLKAIGEDFCDVPLVKNGYTLSASVYAKSVHEAYMKRKSSDKAKEQMDAIKSLIKHHLSSVNSAPNFEQMTSRLDSRLKELREAETATINHLVEMAKLFPSKDIPMHVESLTLVQNWVQSLIEGTKEADTALSEQLNKYEQEMGKLQEGLKKSEESQHSKAEEKNKLARSVLETTALLQTASRVKLSGLQDSGQHTEEDVQNTLTAITAALKERLELRALLERVTKERAPVNPSGPRGLSRTFENNTGLLQWQRSVEDACGIYRFIASVPEGERSENNPRELLEKWFKDSLELQQHKGRTAAHLRFVMQQFPGMDGQDSVTELKQVEAILLNFVEEHGKTVSGLKEKTEQLAAVLNAQDAVPKSLNNRLRAVMGPLGVHESDDATLESLVPAIEEAVESARKGKVLEGALQKIIAHPIISSFGQVNLDKDIEAFSTMLYDHLSDRESALKVAKDEMERIPILSTLLDRILHETEDMAWFKPEASDIASETDPKLGQWQQSADFIKRICTALRTLPHNNSTDSLEVLLERWYSDSCRLKEMAESLNVHFRPLVDLAGIPNSTNSEKAWDLQPIPEHIKWIADKLLERQNEDKHTIKSLSAELWSKDTELRRAQEETAPDTSGLEEYRDFFETITRHFENDIKYITNGLLQTKSGYAGAICTSHSDNKVKIQEVRHHVDNLIKRHPSPLGHLHQCKDDGLVESVDDICDGMDRVFRLVGPTSNMNEAMHRLGQHKQQALAFKEHVNKMGHALGLHDDGPSVEGFAERIEQELQTLDKDYKDMTQEARIREVMISRNPEVFGIRAFHHALRDYLKEQDEEHIELAKRIRDLGAMTQEPHAAPPGTDQSPEVKPGGHRGGEKMGLPQDITYRFKSISAALGERLELRDLLERLTKEIAPTNPSGLRGISRTSENNTGLLQWQRSVEDVCEIYRFIASVPEGERSENNPRELLEKWYNGSKRAQKDLECSRRQNSESQGRLVQRADQMKLWYDSVYGFATEEERESLTRKADMVSISSDTMQEGYTAPFRDLVHDTQQLHSFLKKIGEDFCDITPIVRSGCKFPTSAYAESVYRAYRKARDRSNEIRQEVARMVESHPSVMRSSDHGIPGWDLSTTVRNICCIAKGHLDSINAPFSSKTMTGRLYPDLTGRWESSTADATIESHLRSMTGILQLEYNATIDDIKREIRSLAERSEKDRRDVMQKDAQVSSYETDIRELQRKLARLESALRTKEQENIELSSYKSDILELRRKLERLDAALALEARETAKLSTHDFNNTHLQRKLEELEAELSSKEQEDVQLSNRIRTLWAMTQAPHVRSLPSGRWTKLKHDWMLRAFWAKGNMDHAVSNNDALEAISAALVEWVKCRDLLELIVDAATRMKWEPKLLSSASEDEHRLVQWQESVTLVVRICECVRVAFQDQGSNGGPEGILKALPVDSRELQAYRRAIPAHLRQESNFKPEKLLKRWSADSAELQQYRQRTAEHLQLVMGLLSECPDSLSTGQHVVQQATFESVEQAVKSTLHSRQRTQAELEAAVSKLSHESKSAPGAEQSSRPVDRSASTIRQPRVEDNFTQIQQTLEAIKSTLDGTSAAGRPDSNSEVLIEFGASLNAALKSQKLDPTAIEEIIRPCLTSHDIDATVGVMVASLQARLESSVKDSLSAFIRAQAKPRITEVASPARPQNQEGVCPYCRKRVYSEFARDQERIYAHEEIIFEESHRPMIGVVTSLTKKSLYILVLTGNKEAVPYERLLHECDADTAAHNARVLYEECLQMVATGQNRLRQVPDELAFEGCDVKIWVLKGIIFEVRLRNGETREVPGNCLKNWGAHALDRMRDAVRAYKRKAIPPSPDPAYLAERVKDVLNP